MRILEMIDVNGQTTWVTHVVRRSWGNLNRVWPSNLSATCVYRLCTGPHDVREDCKWTMVVLRAFEHLGGIIEWQNIQYERFKEYNSIYLVKQRIVCIRGKIGELLLRTNSNYTNYFVPWPVLYLISLRYCDIFVNTELFAPLCVPVTDRYFADWDQV